MARNFKSQFAVRATFFYVVATQVGYSDDEAKSLALATSREIGQRTDGGYRGGMGYRLGTVAPLSRPSTAGMKRMGTGLCYEMPFCGTKAFVTPAEDADEIRAYWSGKRQNPAEFDRMVTGRLGSGFMPLVRKVVKAIQNTDLEADAVHILSNMAWR